jgi:transposase InsO family protein
MHAFVTTANTHSAWRNRTPFTDASPTRALQRHLRQLAAAVQTWRRSVREQRRQEDAAWQVLRDERRRAQAVVRRHGLPEYATYLAQEQHWRALRQQRQATLELRQQDDLVWRQERVHLRHALADVSVVRTWRAILIVTDNCTRACYGLPLFVDGPKVTSEQVIAALTSVLPPELSFLISDRGTHFTAHTFAMFAHQHGFVHVPISRHRPQTNGIAERCVRTLKEWLRQHAWMGDEKLLTLLAQFVEEYNERPHQGVGIPGLSPNEFARRIWLL